jgi:hypothetical protein
VVIKVPMLPEGLRAPVNSRNSRSRPM